MKILAAIDSFKGSLSSVEAGNAAAQGILRAMPEAQVTVRPLADGGEGTAEALVTGLGGTFREAEVSDPIGRRITARYGILPGGKAVIEMAAASGLPLLAENERDPMLASTYGTGELIRDAVSQGCREFIIGIGGSATNDGGIGCLQALGFSMLDKNSKPVSPGAKGLSQLAEIRADNVLPELSGCSFNVACDVTNPLCGGNGCSAVFAPQKGADSGMIAEMDRWLRRYAGLARNISPDADPELPGAGAAGGMGFALRYFLGAKLEPGAGLIIRETGLEQLISQADIVVTGEGRIDSQTAMGKAPAGVAAIAKKYGKPVIAFCGSLSGDSFGDMDGVFPILREICTLSQAMEPARAKAALSDTAQQVFRLISSLR